MSAPMTDTPTDCTVCALPFTAEEWDDRHWPHDTDCPRHTDPTSYLTCYCNNEVHAKCCTDTGCN